MKTQKTSNSQNNFEKELEVQESGSLNSDYITKLQSNQNSMVFAQKQNYRSMEEDRKSRDKPTHLWSPNL